MAHFKNNRILFFFLGCSLLGISAITLAFIDGTAGTEQIPPTAKQSTQQNDVLASPISALMHEHQSPPHSLHIDTTQQTAHNHETSPLQPELILSAHMQQKRGTDTDASQKTPPESPTPDQLLSNLSYDQLGAGGFPPNIALPGRPGTDDSKHEVKYKLPEALPQEILVKFKKNIPSSEITTIYDRLNTEVISTISDVDIQRIKVPPGESIESMLKKFNEMPEVEYVEPNVLFHVQFTTPNDPNFHSLWGLNQYNDIDIDAPEAWDSHTGDTIIIADIDTGVDYGHEDLAANIWVNENEIPNNGVDDDLNGYIDDYYGWDFFNNDNDPMDDHGHGTHTAGTIAAVGNNGIGVTGVNWQARVMSLKFMDSRGWGTSSAAAQAILYASSMGAKVANNSWGCLGSSCFSQTLRDAIEVANQREMLFVAAAGNSDNDNDVTPAYPCSYDNDNVICVAATDRTDQKASFSNDGASTVDLAAPGVNILSTVPTGTCSLCSPSGYRSLNGTSMAAPHVSGAVALIMANSPALSLGEVKRNLFSSVESSSVVTKTRGRLNLNNSINLNYFLTTREPIVRVPAGQSTDTVINISYLDEYDTQVNVNISTPPTGLTAEIDSNILSPISGSTNLTINSTVGMTAGKYDIIISGTSTDGLGTTRITTLTVVVETDLSLTEIISPNQGQVGKWIKVTDTAANLGTGNADDIIIHYFLSSDPVITASDIPIGDRWIASLVPGDSNNQTTTLWIPDWNNPFSAFPPIAEGTYYLGGIVNKDNLIAEYNSDNNVLIGSPIAISPRSTPPPTEWDSEYDTISFDDARFIDKDSSGNTVVSGMNHSRGLDGDFITLKYDADGNELWSESYDNGGYDDVAGLIIDDFDNIYITGRSFNGTDYDYATIKYAQDGEQLWITRYNGGGHDFPQGLSLDQDNNLYVTGIHSTSGGGRTIKYAPNGTQLHIYYTTGHGKNSISDSAGNLYIAGGMYIVKFSADYNQLWERTTSNWSNTSDYIFIDQIEIGPDNNIYLGGRAAYIEDLFSLRNRHTRFMAAKYDSDGNPLWFNFHGFEKDSRPLALTVDTTGNLYLSGTTSDGDYPTVKFDAAGSLLWATKYSNSSHATFSDMTMDNAGNIYVTGWSCNEVRTQYSPCPTAFFSGTENYVATGGLSTIIIKYAPDGTPLWSPRYSLFSTQVSGLVVDDSGDIFITSSKAHSYSHNTLLGILTSKISNHPPLTPSNFSGPTTGTIGTSLNYTSSTTDPEGDKIRYTFDWGDGSSSSSEFVASGESVTMNHQWTAAGEYQIRVQATDQHGNASGWSSTTAVTIINNPPAPPLSPSGFTTGNEGETLAFTSSTVDPEGNQIQYTFNWGDGVSSTSELIPSGIPATLTHHWTAAGEYQIQVQATDQHGNSSEWSATSTVTIINQAPSSPGILVNPTSAYIDDEITITTEAFDPEGDRIQYTFNWGNGSSMNMPLISSGTTLSLNHQWENVGEYQVQVQATDENGNSSWSAPITVNIINRPPAYPEPPQGPTTGIKGELISFTVSTTDPESHQVSYTFNWGDGTSDNTELTASGEEISLGHHWTNAGTYKIEIYAIDALNTSTADPVTIQITITSKPETNSGESGGGSIGLFGLLTLIICVCGANRRLLRKPKHHYC